MKLEDQVCSLELAKRLKELGFKRGSYFFWTHPWCTTTQECEENGVKLSQIFAALPYIENKMRWTICISEPRDKECYAAFTVAELGEMLPRGFYTWKNEHWCGSKKETQLMEVADTEADARAKMLIHLIENGTVKPKAGSSEGGK